MESLLRSITEFLSELNIPFIQLELGREFVTLTVDIVAQIVFRGTDDTLR